MNLEVLNKILQNKQIIIDDHIKFNKIIDVLNDVLNVLFIDENKQSVLKVGYKVNDKEHI
ncbi:hypothetical protein [Mesoplasma melaleucae]|uniref:Uncharacterized protein n=1 Tax=Mesoplasma melaleucae TaxID=81459 RepID=A0A2K8NZE7_9MOLU|nr:hypothetical protein [Mesoplasma melaleucae]ATZ18003.1 hypothetical protein EMELA_v1c04600 [Mesoplasma melaleucae]